MKFGIGQDFKKIYLNNVCNVLGCIYWNSQYNLFKYFPGKPNSRKTNMKYIWLHKQNLKPGAVNENIKKIIDLS